VRFTPELLLELVGALPPGGISVTRLWLAQDCAIVLGVAVFVVGRILYNKSKKLEGVEKRNRGRVAAR